MNVLIINLTRFGDLLQTQPVAHNLHEQGHRVGLVCLDNFAAAAELLEHVDLIAALPGSLILSNLMTRHWTNSLDALHRWVEQVRQSFMADKIINLTSSTSARLLARRLGGADTEYLGFNLDEHGFGVTGSAWTTFFEASTRTRGCSPYNLVDVFSRAAGLDRTAAYKLSRPDNHTLDKLRELLKQNSPADCVAYVAFQLGASETRRQWPAEYFAELGKHLWATRKILPVLTGSKLETELAISCMQAGCPGIDLTGKTDLRELSALLCHMKLLVTNDTGTMHLAAGLGLPSLAIFLATAQPWDTGPYLENCCCLEPDLLCHPCQFGSKCANDLVCMRHITPDSVIALVSHYLDRHAWPQKIDPPHPARIWRTVRDMAGYLDLEPLCGQERQNRSAWIAMQRHYYRQFLDVAGKALYAETSFISAPKMLANMLDPAWRANAQNTLRQADGLLHLFIEQGRLMLVNPTEQSGQRFMSTCHRISSIFDQNTAFDSLWRLWHGMSQELGGNFEQLLIFGRQLRAFLNNWLEYLTWHDSC